MVRQAPTSRRWVSDIEDRSSEMGVRRWEIGVRSISEMGFGYRRSSGGVALPTRGKGDGSTSSPRVGVRRWGSTAWNSKRKKEKLKMQKEGGRRRTEGGMLWASAS